jgi:two-component system OmpR family sensor kinase
LKLRGIRGRWMLGGIAVVLGVVIIAVAAFSLVIGSYYHGSVRTGLEAKAQTASEFFTNYVSRTYADYYQSAYRYAETFEDKDKLELQFVNTRGRVEISTYGITAGTSPGTADILSAIDSGEISTWTGKLPATGERIMAVSCPLLYADGTVVGVMRYVTSMKLVDRQILQVSALAAGVGLIILLLVILSNLYFIRTITDPIIELTGVARRIAEGSYGVQAIKKYDDEIGDLTDAINEMSVKIGQAEKMQTEFISSVSHELRTPLTAITGWSETLQYDKELSGDTRQGLEIISKEAARLTKMVEELLEFTRLQDGRFNLNITQVNVAALLQESMLTYSELLRKERMELVYRPCKRELPLIPGDPERLKQVFLNVLDNASKYGRDGKRIIVATELAEGCIAISVRDFGPGIPEDELPHVKEKFYKGSSKERGSGIGLAVCDEIVTRHKGRLSIANARGGGVAVTILLPAPVIS